MSAANLLPDVVTFWDSMMRVAGVMAEQKMKIEEPGKCEMMMISLNYYWALHFHLMNH